MSFVNFKLTRDDISPALSKLAATARNPTAVYRAMGTTFKSITEGAFNSVGASYRPKPWPAKKDGTPSNLQKSTTLAKSFHLEVTPSGATLTNPTVYAMRHQFGDTNHVAGVKIGTTKAKGRRAGSGQDIFSGSKGMPPRPFYPVLDGKLTPAAENLIARAGERALAREVGGEVK